MKRRLYLILLFAAVTLSGMAQNVGEAFYIYRNDGEFNAFFRDEVQSIDYSYEDADGNTYDEIVTQIVTTADSVYRIPIAAIDSLSFVQPETVFQSNVIQMEQKGLSAYLQAIDGMALLFDTSIPQSLQPKVGDILLSTDFGSSLLPDGFVGKVVSTQIQAGTFRVECEMVSDIFAIFEQLVSIEQIRDRNNSAPGLHRISDEWISNRNPINFYNLGYSHPLSDGQASLSSSIDGSYIATVAYNITRKEQHITLRFNHDWQYGAHLNFKSDAGFGTFKGPVVSLPAIRFPAVAPVFKFQVSGVPFAKGEGNMELDFSLNSPVHSYLTEVAYHNGHFSGGTNELPVQGANNPSIDAAFSLNGSLQIGYMVDFWLGIDIFGSLFKLGTGLDFYIGPKLTGDFSMKLGTGSPVNYYSTYKDSKLGLSLVTIDYEFFGEAALAGHTTPRGMFCDGTIQTPLYHEWYILPEFSELSVEKDADNKKATISTTPTRDILVPLNVGMGLYDKDGNHLNSTNYETQKYKRENEGYRISQTFISLETNKDYTAKPMIKILDGEVPALPEETFKLEGESTCPDANHPHMIDLGLPSGTKWACCNVGASAPEGYGNYYTWGETQPKSVYNWDTYQYGSSGDNVVNIGSDIAGTQYDAATANWGVPWRMPSKAQIQELLNNCSSTWTTQNGVNGRKFTGPNGGTIFLPAAGSRWGDELGSLGSWGDYWSSTLNEGNPNYAYGLGFDSDGAYCYDYGRNYGHSVRPVR